MVLSLDPMTIATLTSFVARFGISRRKRSPSPPKDPPRKSCSKPTSQFSAFVGRMYAALVSGSKSVYVRPSSIAAICRRTLPRTTFNPGPSWEMRNRNHANRSCRSSGSFKPPPLEPFFASPSSSFFSGGSPRKTAGATAMYDLTRSGATSAASNATGAPAEWPSRAAVSTPSASINFSVSSAWPSAVYTKLTPSPSVDALGASGRVDRPYGGRSNAMHRVPGAAAATLGSRRRNENSLPFAPCRQTSASTPGPSFFPCMPPWPGLGSTTCSL